MIYRGTLDYKKMSIDARKAYYSWTGQMAKCSNPKNALYKYYGAKGIKVKYSSREFIGWWLERSKERTHWKKRNCGRLDHDKDYSFDNITLQESSENIAERNTRVSSKKVAVFFYGKYLCSFKSVKDVAQAFKTDKTYISKRCRGVVISDLNGYNFLYESIR